MMWFYTGKGDEGKANLFDGRRLPKSSPVFDLIGALDEATAHIGLAISFSNQGQIKQDLAQIQDDLSKLMGLIAGATPASIGDRFLVADKLDWIESRIVFYGESLDNPHAFVYAGKTRCGASLDIARTVVRRAERIFTQLMDEDDPKHSNLPYLNRLSSLLFILRLFVDDQTDSNK
jgi:cob(I)alamin adenosyltransferase